MTNHVHLIAVPTYESSLTFVVRDASGLCAVYFNSKYGFSGHLWQARFYSCLPDEEHFWSAIRYVERNPVRAKMVSEAENYPWSSAAARCLSQPDPLLAPLQPPAPISDWRSWLHDEEEATLPHLIRRHTGTGRPLWSKSFLQDQEARLGRPLIPRKAGRKPRIRAAIEQ
jgi:putative transposase